MKKYYSSGERCYNKIKLNTNENIFSSSKNIYFLINIFNLYNFKFKFYPENNCLFLKIILSKYYNIHKDKIFICNGSDEGLGFIFNLFKKFSLKFYKFSYPFYEIYCKYNKIKFKCFNNILLNIKNVILTIPNSPTGDIFSILSINKLIKKKSILIIDEAYNDFYYYDYLKFVSSKNNLIIIKTLSKSFSIANLRIGIIFSNKKIIKYLNYIKNCFNSYTVSSLNSYIAIESIKDINYLNYTVQNNIYLKILFIFSFKYFFFSYGNFILFKSNIDFFFFLKKKKIFVRKFKKNKIIYLRITIPNFFIIKKILKILKNWS